jgi:peptidoglycan hydrolase CwlO-like protein
MKLKEKQEKINKMKKEVEKLQQQINQEESEQRSLIAVEE